MTQIIEKEWLPIVYNFLFVFKERNINTCKIITSNDIVDAIDEYSIKYGNVEAIISVTNIGKALS